MEQVDHRLTGSAPHFDELRGTAESHDASVHAAGIADHVGPIEEIVGLVKDYGPKPEFREYVAPTQTDPLPGISWEKA